MRKSFAMSVLALSLVSSAAFADMPGRHPYYLHALSDLRAARWMVEHRPGDPAVSSQEDVAIQQIDGAIHDIKAASIDDGKNLQDHPGVDMPNDHRGKLHKAVALLRKVRADVAREEDDPAARGLQQRSIAHIDAALNATRQALAYAEHHM